MSYDWVDQHDSKARWIARLRDLYEHGNKDDRDVRLEVEDLVQSLLRNGMNAIAIKEALYGPPPPPEPTPEPEPAPEPIIERPWYWRLVGS